MAASGSTELATNRRSPLPSGGSKTSARSWLSISADRHPRGPERKVTTEAMVASVLVAKYALHLPLYRQAQIA